jgi:hypothetical protein
LVITVESSRAPRVRPRHRAHLRFGAAQVRGADLHASRAQRERRCNPAPVGNAAGRDHRHLHRIHHLRHQRKGAGLLGDFVGQEHAAVATGFGALRDDNVGSVLVQPDRLPHRGRRRHHEAPGGLDARH